MRIRLPVRMREYVENVCFIVKRLRDILKRYPTFLHEHAVLSPVPFNRKIERKPHVDMVARTVFPVNTLYIQRRLSPSSPRPFVSTRYHEPHAQDTSYPASFSRRTSCGIILIHFATCACRCPRNAPRSTGLLSNTHQRSEAR